MHFVHYFQFISAEVPRGDELLHIISHHKPVTPNEICSYLPVWTKKHHTFVDKISEDILQCKKLTLESYIETVLTPGVPIDEIGLIILARMYHLKLCY